MLAGRHVFFAVGKKIYRATTNRAGIAQVIPSPPLALGMHRIAVRYHGDAHDLGSGIHANADVVNSAGAVTSEGVLQLSDRRSLHLGDVRRRSANGDLTILREPGLDRAVAIGALGMRADGATAWLRGSDPKGAVTSCTYSGSPGARSACASRSSAPRRSERRSRRAGSRSSADG